jgi:signal transduction histidine kinase/ActR/RegA family two-component response regulator
LDRSANSAGDAPAGLQPSGFALFAASTRNYIPRLMAGAAVTSVVGVFLGWTWALAWFAVVVLGLWINHRLMTAVRRISSEAGKRRLWRVSNASSFAFTLVQCAPIIALWRTAEPTAMAFALIAAMIGSTYVLLQYYSDLTQFRLFLLPYAATLLFMAGRLVWNADERGPAIMAVAAGGLAMINYLHFARRQLDSSRAALRQARARAEEKELAAEAASHAKSAFLATMSHEIRTPLNGVLGMAQAMAADELSGRQRDRLSVIHSSGESLLAILNDLLDLSKIEAGKLELESIEFDLGELARGAHSAFTALANKKGLSFALEIEAARGRYRGDPTRLRQILYNLISNALKFTEQGEIRVRAACEGEVLALSVSDTGVGISQENLSRLFGKFDQLDSSTTRRFGGTGLGLSICRELAVLMGGEISVESELGRGSCFTLRVPLPRVGEAKPATVLAPAPPPTLQPGALRVLAAEDNSVNQLVLKTLLHQLGVEPVVVGDGAAAVAAWEGAAWDVVLMDIQMPVMDGLAAAAAIREAERREGRARTPIIALTANAMSHQVEQYLAAGMDGHVAKPIEASALFAALVEATSAEPAGPEAATG